MSIGVTSLLSSDQIWYRMYRDAVRLGTFFVRMSRDGWQPRIDYFLTFSVIIFNCTVTIKYKRQRVESRWIPWYVTLVGCNGGSHRRNCYTLGGSSDNWRWIGLRYVADDADGLFQLIAIPYAVIWHFPLLRSVVTFQTWWQGEITKYAAIGRPYFLEAGDSPNRANNWSNAEIRSGVSGIFPQISTPFWLTISPDHSWTPTSENSASSKMKRICLPRPWLSTWLTDGSGAFLLMAWLLLSMAVRSSVTEVNNPEPRMLGHLYDMLWLYHSHGYPAWWQAHRTSAPFMLLGSCLYFWQSSGFACTALLDAPGWPI